MPLFVCTIGCVSGDVRLVNGTNVTSSVPREGRVEVCINGTFGSICNKRWDSLDAGVVCRQLGYSSTGMDWPVPSGDVPPTLILVSFSQVPRLMCFLELELDPFTSVMCSVLEWRQTS